MEKNSDECHKLNVKKIFKILAIIGLILLIFFAGVWLYKYQPNLPTYKVEYISSQSDTCVQTYFKGDKLNFPENPTKNGYNFVGWSFDKDTNIWVTDELVVDKELTLYAKWEEKTYELKYDDLTYQICYGCDFVTMGDMLTFVDINNENVEIVAISKDGYDFSGWEFCDGEKLIGDISTIDYDQLVTNQLTLKVKAIAKQARFQIIENSNYSISNLSHDDNIKVGETLTFDLTLNESVNRSKINVISSNGCINKSRVANTYNIEVADFTHDFQVYVENVEINEYTINLIIDGETDSVSVKYGSIFKLPKCNKSGYDFVGFKDDQGNLYQDTIIVTSDLKLLAVFEIKTYFIQFPKNTGKYLIKSNDEILTSNAIISKSYLESIEFEIELAKAYSNSNYIVYGVKSGNKISPKISNGKIVFDNIDNNINIYIDNITINKYSLIVDNIDYGKFSYNSFITIVDNGLVIFDNYNNIQKEIQMLINDENFGGWMLENGSIVIDSTIQDLSQSGVVKINGNYSREIYVVTLNANGGYLDQKTLIFFEDDDIILPTISKDGYKFAGWYVELIEKNTIIDESGSIKFDGILNGNISLYAGWTK